jgi:hypothetical protein
MPNWQITHCSYCGFEIPYLEEWGSIPEYCKDCKQWKTRACLGCGGSVQYKVFWDNKPDYCPSCREWLTKGCQGCGTEIRYKRFWDNVPDYCKDCRETNMTMVVTKRFSQRRFNVYVHELGLSRDTEKFSFEQQRYIFLRAIGDFYCWKISLDDLAALGKYFWGELGDDRSGEHADAFSKPKSFVNMECASHACASHACASHIHNRHSIAIICCE